MSHPISNIAGYISKNHPEVEKYYGFIGFGTSVLSQYRTFIVPTKKTFDDIKKNIDSDDVDAYEGGMKMLMSLLFKANLSDPKFSTAPTETVNGLNHVCKISVPKNGEFTISTGKKFDVTLKCHFDKKAIPVHTNNDKTKQRPLCVVIMDSGDISIDGNLREMKGSADVVADILPIAGGDPDTDMSEINRKKRENFESLLTKKNGFEKTIGGLLMYLNKCNIEELEECKKIVANLLSYDAIGTYIALVQPMGERSFLPAILYKEWNFAELFTSDYVTLFEKFVDDNCTKYDDSLRTGLIRSMQDKASMMTDSKVIVDLYKNNLEKVFGESFPLDYAAKLWADEVLYMSAMGADPTDLALAYDGNDYQNTILSNLPHLRTRAKYDNPAELDSKSSAGEFMKSEYMFKCCLVNYPTALKEKLSQCCEMLNEKLRAFCMINYQ